ncbi:hypothetical protein [Caudoviricetes sp.]|nr:hypothetical protein [Caudoviricetes sp.]
MLTNVTKQCCIVATCGQMHRCVVKYIGAW